MIRHLAGHLLDRIARWVCTGIDAVDWTAEGDDDA